MSNDDCISVGVCSRSFSKNPILKRLLKSRYSDVRFNDSGHILSGQSLVEFLRPCTHAIIALEKIDKSVLAALPNLRRISKFGVGIDNIDVDAMADAGVTLGWTPGVNARSVAELILIFAMTLRRNVTLAQAAVKEQRWQQTPGDVLTGSVFGLIGCGHVGISLLKLLRPFECEVLFSELTPRQDVTKAFGAKQVAVQELLKSADTVSIHVPLGPNTENMIGDAELKLMKSTAVLINTSRGGVVCETALKQALLGRSIAGAGFDVFVDEPFFDEELLSLPNFIATPHIAGTSFSAIDAMGRAAIEALFASD